MLFVMGATGRMGGAVLRQATGPVRAGTRRGTGDSVRFDLTDPHSFGPALAGCSAMFVMRPPTIATRAPFDRLMTAARQAGVGHVVCASVHGAGTSRVLPHRHMEGAVRDSGLPHTFLRPADFMQNLADVHGTAIRTKGEIAVPAGRGRSAFVDVEDIGRAAAAVLAAPRDHEGRAYDLTGPEALSFGDVAEVLTAVLGRPIRYRAISVPRFVLREMRGGRPLPMAMVMAALYTVQRLGRAAPVRDDFERLTGQRTTPLAAYIDRERRAFVPEA